MIPVTRISSHVHLSDPLVSEIVFHCIFPWNRFQWKKVSRQTRWKLMRFWVVVSKVLGEVRATAFKKDLLSRSFGERNTKHINCSIKMYVLTFFWRRETPLSWESNKIFKSLRVPSLSILSEWFFMEKVNAEVSDRFTEDSSRRLKILSTFPRIFQNVNHSKTCNNYLVQ